MLGVAASLWVLASACRPSYSAEQNNVSSAAPRAVETTRLQATMAPMPIEATGRLGAGAEATLSFKTGGVVAQILVNEGQYVQKGQTLARLHLEEINAQVSIAQDAYEKASRDLERAARLYKDTVATLEQFQDATTGKQVAAAQLEVALFNRRYAEIKAPQAGRVLRRFAEAEELVSPGQPIFKMGTAGRKSTWVVRIDVADRDIVRLQPDDSAHISFDAYPGQIFKARATVLAQEAHPQSGTYQVELSLDPGGMPLKNGFIANAVLYPRTRQPYYKVPFTALVEASQGQAWVFVAQQNQVFKKQVSPQQLAGQYFTVPTNQLSGPGGQAPEVVTLGAGYLQNGQNVTILKRY